MVHSDIQKVFYEACSQNVFCMCLRNVIPHEKTLKQGPPSFFYHRNCSLWVMIELKFVNIVAKNLYISTVDASQLKKIEMNEYEGHSFQK